MQTCTLKVWNGGLGGQCPLMPVSNSFGLCKTHAHRDAAEGLSHGRVDGPIPLDTQLPLRHVIYRLITEAKHKLVRSNGS